MGIKLICLVSKQLRTAMLDSVQGYTLDFTGSVESLIHTMALLKDARFSLLCVVTPASTGGLLGCEVVRISKLMVMLAAGR